MLYIVKGWMTLTVESDVDPRRRRTKKTVRVNELVEAKNEQRAIGEADSVVCRKHDMTQHGTVVYADWDGEPEVVEAPQDIAMAHLPRDIAPTLPGIEL